MVLDFIINPFLYTFSTMKNTYVYVPYKHQLKKFSKQEFEQIRQFNITERSNLSEEKIIVEKDYAQNMLEFFNQDNSKPELNILYLILTDACNFKCKYCFVEGNYEEVHRKYMTLNTSKKWIDHFFENQTGETARIIFYGGEVLLNKEVLLESINYIREKEKQVNKKVEITINTNAYLLFPDAIKVFKEHNVTLAISIDGPPKINDVCRVDSGNNGTAEQVIKNVQEIARQGVNIGFSITISKTNYKLLPAIAKWITQEFPFIKSVGFNPPLCSNKNKDEEFPFEEIMFYMYCAFRVFREHDVNEDRITRRIKPIIDQIPYFKDCGACGNQIVVSAEGMIGPCHGFLGTKEFFQNVNPKTFKIANNDTFQKWNLIQPTRKDDCKDCEFIMICANACPYVAYLKEKSIFAKDDRMCEMMPGFMREILYDQFYPKPKMIFIDFEDVLFDSEDQNRLNVRLVKQLQEINLRKFLLSTSDKKIMLNFLKHHNLTEQFEDVFSIKRNKEMIQSLLRKLNVEPEDVIYIGANFQFSIRPFYDLGIQAVSYQAKDNKLLENNWLSDIFNSFENE